jgi:serine phosphatase RsbU (regulator of sigma subunit)
MTVARNRAVELALDERVHVLQPMKPAASDRRYVVGHMGATIGRKPPAEVVLDDSEVSRAHCRLELRGDDLYAVDLGSTNGTFVDGERITGPVLVPIGAVLQVGRTLLMHEVRTERELLAADELDRDLEKASSYVQALLPAPITEGSIRAEWLLKPCARLGGDAFGYRDLSPDLFAVYLMDVSGHGAGAALHSVAVMNALRQGALPGADLSRPSEVLAALNDMFQMDRYAELYFTLWYGVFNRASRRLEYASAGCHPALLVPSDRSEAIPLRTKNGMIGAVPGKAYAADEVEIPNGASLYLFSDGVFEVVDCEGRQRGLEDFLPLVLKPRAMDATECERLHAEVAAAARPGPLDDDFSMVVLTLD